MPKRLRGQTVAEALHSSPPSELVELASAWAVDASSRIIDLIWKGYDVLSRDPAVVPALQLATDDLERGITQLLELAIQNELSGDEPFYVQHGVPEGEARKAPPARPPEYDIAFVMRGNIRIMWPIEAKVMPPLRPMSEYVRAVVERYLTCEYAPFVGAGAMVGYVLQADGNELFYSIASALKVELQSSVDSGGRAHRFSMHDRQVPEGKPYPSQFVCHHILLTFRANLAEP